MKALIVLVISLLDSTMTIDSHNYHFIFDYMILTFKNLDLAQTHKESADLVLNVIDSFL